MSYGYSVVGNSYVASLTAITDPTEREDLRAEIIASITNDREDAVFRRTQAQRAIDAAAERKARLEADVATAQAQISTLNTVIAALPDGEIKNAFIHDRTLEEQRLYRAQFSLDNLNTSTLLANHVRWEQFSSIVAGLGGVLSAVNAVPSL